MTRAELLNEIGRHMQGMSEPSRHALLESAKMLSKGMDIPSNMGYLRSRLIGTEAEKSSQIETALKAYGQHSKLA